MPEHDLTLFVEGHPGHRGNVLAQALVAKLSRILSALAQADRRYSGRAQRQTDYEVSSAGKTNPTHISLHPVPRVMNYDPRPAFDWTLEQFANIAAGRPIDDRLDATFVETVAELAERRREDDYVRLWLRSNGIAINLDDSFRAHCLTLAAVKAEIEKPSKWFDGVAHGSVVGDLKQVADIEGEHQFVILPPVGAQRITCTFPEAKREKMREFLFRTVRVIGKLTYRWDSPFPVSVEMDDIEAASPVESPKHLLELRGILKGTRRPKGDNLGQLLYEL